jgi:hypothetical protein
VSLVVSGLTWYYTFAFVTEEVAWHFCSSNLHYLYWFSAFTALSGFLRRLKHTLGIISIFWSAEFLFNLWLIVMNKVNYFIINSIASVAITNIATEKRAYKYPQ